MYWYYKWEFEAKPTVIKGDDGKPIYEKDDVLLQHPKTKMVLALSTCRIGMGICDDCKHAGAIGMECPLCKGPFLIMNTKTKDIGDDNLYDAFWPKACISPWEMVKLVHVVTPPNFFTYGVCVIFIRLIVKNSHFCFGSGY